MKKIELSKIDKNKKYKLVINKVEVRFVKGKCEEPIDIINYLKDYYNFGDMICDEEVKNEKEFLEYLPNRKSPGCDKIELFEV